MKKIFQVQFAAPRIDQRDLGQFIEAIAVAADLPVDQREDLRTVVSPHVNYVAGTSSVNPREVKRLINVYTMQMKMFGTQARRRKTDGLGAGLLALQVMHFRPDWQACYEVLTTNPSDFVDAVQDALSRGVTMIAVAEQLVKPPPSLVSYLRSDGSDLLGLGPLIDVYVSTVELAHSTDPGVRDAAQALGRLRVALSQRAAGAGAAKDVLEDLSERLGRYEFPETTDALTRIWRVDETFPQLGQHDHRRQQRGRCRTGAGRNGARGVDREGGERDGRTRAGARRPPPAHVDRRDGGGVARIRRGRGGPGP